MGGRALKAFVRAVSHSESAGRDVIPCTAALQLSDSPQPVHHTTLEQMKSQRYIERILYYISDWYVNTFSVS